MWRVSMPDGITLNHQFLVEIGLGHLESEQQQVIIDKLARVLQMRVGQALYGSLTKSEQMTFERYIDEGNDQGAQAFLARVVPDYPYVVRAELDFIVSSILQSVRQRR